MLLLTEKTIPGPDFSTWLKMHNIKSEVLLSVPKSFSYKQIWIYMCPSYRLNISWIFIYLFIFKKGVVNWKRSGVLLVRIIFMKFWFAWFRIFTRNKWHLDTNQLYIVGLFSSQILYCYMSNWILGDAINSNFTQNLSKSNSMIRDKNTVVNKLLMCCFSFLLTEKNGKFTSSTIEQNDLTAWISSKFECHIMILFWNGTIWKYHILFIQYRECTGTVKYLSGKLSPWFSSSWMSRVNHFSDSKILGSVKHLLQNARKM